MCQTLLPWQEETLSHPSLLHHLVWNKSVEAFGVMLVCFSPSHKFCVWYFHLFSVWQWHICNRFCHIHTRLKPFSLLDPKAPWSKIFQVVRVCVLLANTLPLHTCLQLYCIVRTTFFPIVTIVARRMSVCSKWLCVITKHCRYSKGKQAFFYFYPQWSSSL